MDFNNFWATIYKTVRPMLSDRCLSVCPVLSVTLCIVAKRLDGQDETWHAGRLVPGHIVLDRDPGPPPQRGTALNFRSISVVAGWIKMPLGTNVGLSPSRIVLHGDLAPPPKRSIATNFRPLSIVAKRSPISTSAEHLLIS